MHFVIINGPNLNLLGKREPDIYGNTSFEQYLSTLREMFSEHRIDYFQSNHEGALIDQVQEAGFSTDGIVINAGAYTHTSIALRDAISAVTAPVVEVHISNIYQRETFRQHSYLTDVCLTAHIGEGLEGYKHAIEDLINHLS